MLSPAVSLFQNLLTNLAQIGYQLKNDHSTLIPSVTIDDEFFDLTTMQRRSDAAQYLLKCTQLGIHKVQTFTRVSREFPDIIKLVHESASDLIQYEFIRHADALCALLCNFLHAEIDSQPTDFFILENTQAMMNSLETTIGYLFRQTTLVRKFILDLERPLLWKPFIHSMISVMNTKVLLQQSRDLWEICWINVLMSIKYWTREHVLFAFEHGLVKSIALIMREDPLWTINQEFFAMWHDNVMLFVFTLVFMHLRRLDRKNRSSLHLDLRKRLSAEQRVQSQTELDCKKFDAAHAKWESSDTSKTPLTSVSMNIASGRCAKRTSKIRGLLPNASAKAVARSRNALESIKRNTGC